MIGKRSGSNPRPEGLRAAPSASAPRWMAAVAASLAVGIAVAIGRSRGWSGLEASGIVQPLFAFALSGCFACAVRGWGGRLFDGGKRGEVRPSPALVLGRLWLQCFAVIMLAVLLAAMVAKLSFDRVEADVGQAATGHGAAGPLPCPTAAHARDASISSPTDATGASPPDRTPAVREASKPC